MDVAGCVIGVAPGVEVASASPLTGVAVEFGLPVDGVADVLEPAVAEADADEFSVTSGRVVAVEVLLSEPPQAARARAPMPMSSVASVFTIKSPGASARQRPVGWWSHIRLPNRCVHGTKGGAEPRVCRRSQKGPPRRKAPFPKECWPFVLAAGDREGSGGGGGNHGDGAKDDPQAG